MFGKHLRRQRMICLLLASLAVAAQIYVDRTLGVLPVEDDWHRYHGQSFEVVRVIDGDTLELRVSDGEHRSTRVGLWGVQCPALADALTHRPEQPHAQEAADHTRMNIGSGLVTLELQRYRTRDEHGRVLAYVRLSDGTGLAESLLQSGLARQEGRWSHDRLAEFEKLEQAARQNQAGIWP